MSAIENYDKIKGEILHQINKTLNWLQEGENFGVSFQEEQEKLFNLKNNLEDSKIKIALVGAFSEGKTTMVASWLGKVEDDMKIHHEESSNAICLYQPEGLEDKCVIIDTPGLFGNKEIESKDGIIKYKEITQKFISEAHLILYVINPVNLIKDSHKETCQWLFRDLRKLENTVFVINRFDEIADLDDKQDFSHQFEIKKASFINSLDRFIQLNEQEKSALNIIAISANPYAEGLDYWFKHQDEFESISRINDLRSITNNIITNSSTSIYTNQIKSVVNDLVSRKKDDIIQILDQHTEVLNISDKNLKNIKEDIDQVTKDINANFLSLKREIITYLGELSSKIKSADEDTLGQVMDKEIGNNGTSLDMNLEEILIRYTNENISELKKIGTKIEDEFRFSEKMADNFLKSLMNKGLSSIKHIPIDNMRNFIIGSRDTLVKTINSFGGKIAMKFKPWGAVKFAKNIGKAAVALTLLIEVVDIWMSYRKKKQFDEAKKNILEFIKNIQDFYDEMFQDAEHFKQEYFPELKEYIEIYEQLRHDNNNMRNTKHNLENWFKTSTDIQDIDFEYVE